MKRFFVDIDTRKLALRGFILTFLLGSIVCGCISSLMFLFPSPQSITDLFKQNGLLAIPLIIIGWPLISMEAAFAYFMAAFPFFFLSALLIASFILIQRRLGFIQAMFSGTVVPLIYISLKCLGKCEKTVDSLFNGIIENNDVIQAAIAILIPAASWGVAWLIKDRVVMGLEIKPAST